MKIKNVEVKVIKGGVTEEMPEVGGSVATVDKDLDAQVSMVRDAFCSALRAAKDTHQTFLAVPAFGCFAAGLAAVAAAKVMAQEVFRFAREEESSLKEVNIVFGADEGFDVFKETVESYLSHVATKLSEGPFVTVDIVIELAGGVVLIKRSNPPFGWALPGGFVDYGESLEASALREAKEETGLDVKRLRQMHTYSDPGRDPRFHTISTVFVGQATGRPKADSDAAEAEVFTKEECQKLLLAFDHKKILEDYFKEKGSLED